jgi:hypothetical protein
LPSQRDLVVKLPLQALISRLQQVTRYGTQCHKGKQCRSAAAGCSLWFGDLASTSLRHPEGHAARWHSAVQLTVAHVMPHMAASQRLQCTGTSAIPHCPPSIGQPCKQHQAQPVLAASSYQSYTALPCVVSLQAPWHCIGTTTHQCPHLQDEHTAAEHVLAVHPPTGWRPCCSSCLAYGCSAMPPDLLHTTSMMTLKSHVQPGTEQHALLPPRRMVHSPAACAHITCRTAKRLSIHSTERSSFVCPVPSGGLRQGRHTSCSLLGACCASCELNLDACRLVSSYTLSSAPEAGLHIPHSPCNTHSPTSVADCCGDVLV